MSSSDPPIYYFNNIKFNEDFYNYSTSLSLSYANSHYLPSTGNIIVKGSETINSSFFVSGTTTLQGARIAVTPSRGDRVVAFEPVA